MNRTNLKYLNFIPLCDYNFITRRIEVADQHT